MTNTHLSHSRLGQALIIGASLLLVACLLALAGLVLALQQRALEPPQFAVHVGHVYWVAPCPPPYDCDVKLNYYAVWRGHDLPNGEIHYDEVFFTYLPQKR